MYPDAAVEYIIHHSDPQSRPDSAMKIFVLIPHGPLYEVYGWESDIAAMADEYDDSIYFWAEGSAEDFAPELTMDEAMSLITTYGIAVNGPTAAENSGANPVSLSDVGTFVTDVVRPFPGVETA